MRLHPFGLAYAALLIWLALQLVALSRAGRSLAASRRFRLAAGLGGLAICLGPLGTIAVSMARPVDDTGRLLDGLVLASLTAAAAGIRQVVAGVRAA